MWEFLSAWSEVYGMECESSFLSSVSASIRGANSSVRARGAPVRPHTHVPGPDLLQMIQWQAARHPAAPTPCKPACSGRCCLLVLPTYSAATPPANLKP